MNHNHIRHKLSEYLDNALSADEQAAVEEHLRSCTTCSNALDELRKTVEQVKQVEEVESPAWMTQKIMAKVRAEAEAKRSWYQRFFFPLTVKLPIQAVAVLFLAVTAYYVYQNVNPAEKYAEAPQAASPAKEQTIAEEAPDRSKQVEQSPGYKALDMKPAYEKPALPKPADKAESPAPTKTAEQRMAAEKEFTAGKVDAPPRAGASALTRERAAGEALPLEARPQATTKQKRALAMTDEVAGNIMDRGQAGQFHLRINEDASIEPENIKFTFTGITEDSRCPSGAQCIWEGQVTIAISVLRLNQSRDDIRLTLRAGNHEDLAVKIVDGYSIKLLQVEPYPTRDQKTNNTDYIITVLISKI